MKIFLIIIFFSIFSKAQNNDAKLLRIPVNKFKRYENCCLQQSDCLRTLINPIENELRIYGDENESNVLSYKAGKVVKIIKDKFDNSITILVKSDELIFVYMNMNNIKVTENDEISESQNLGQIMTLNSENYLRFEIWNNKAEKLNPIKYLEGNP